MKSYIGKRFGKLVVNSEKHLLKSNTKIHICECKCDCGNIKEVRRSSLMFGKTKSCGCYRKEVLSKLYTKNYVGKRFARLLVLSQESKKITNKSNKKVICLCQCDCGNKTEVAACDLCSGHTKSCGCFMIENSVKNLKLSKRVERHSDETKRKMSLRAHERVKNGTNPFYIHGKSKENKTERQNARKSIEYKIWRINVFERDNYTCQECGVRGAELHADHIKQWAFYPELRYDVNNGRTLCVDCHRDTPTWGNQKKVEST